MRTSFVLFTLLLALTGCGKSDAGERFRTSQTKNIWTQLLLDTRTGQVWQIAQTNSGTAKIAINDKDLGSGFFSSNGRFELTLMQNIWSFTLTDRKTGKMWRGQFSNSPLGGYIVPIE